MVNGAVAKKTRLAFCNLVVAVLLGCWVFTPVEAVIVACTRYDTLCVVGISGWFVEDKKKTFQEFLASQRLPIALFFGRLIVRPFSRYNSFSLYIVKDSRKYAGVPS